MLWKPKDSMKRKCYVFNDYKQRNKVYLVYFECQLHYDTYGCFMFKLKIQKTLETTYSETR